MKLSFAITLALVDFAHVQAQSAKPVILVQSSILNASKQLNEPLIFNTPPPHPLTPENPSGALTQEVV
ncbi:hypothetical protein [Scytonema sp. PRP1]|uniref:hypothetical protein n=1 Tax=Scytonema sp. PRP1 TaxID=3120513 RepID=UPI00300CF2E9